MMVDFQLHRDAFGKLVLSQHGVEYVGITPVRAFPIAAPDEGISLLDADGHELVWLEQSQDAPEAVRALIEEELAAREFMPQIARIKGVSSFATPSTWQVATDRGDTEFVLKGEEDIRRLAAYTLLIADSHGIQFLIRDTQILDRHSRKILERFL